MTVAQGELAQGMASTGHILLGNRKVIHANGSTPITSFYPIQADHVGSPGLAVEPRPRQCLPNQWSAAC
jgi:hypothetical protein